MMLLACPLTTASTTSSNQHEDRQKLPTTNTLTRRKTKFKNYGIKVQDNVHYKFGETILKTAKHFFEKTGLNLQKILTHNDISPIIINLTNDTDADSDVQISDEDKHY